MGRRLLARVREILGRYFVAGILAFAPIAVTIWAIAWIIQRLDNLLLPRLVELIFPSLEDPPQWPLVGALFTILVILLFGVIARHFFGGEVVRVWERLLGRVPIARSIYGAVKQLLEAIFSSTSTQSFNRVVLIEYPRKGLYALAFTTGPARGIIQDVTESQMINCFIPTTPNPTSGFYLLVPEEELTALDLTVEEAFKLIMSAGLVAPEMRPPHAPAVGVDPATLPVLEREPS